MSRVANRYSKALFEASLEQKKLDMVKDDLKDIQLLIEKNSDFRDMILSPLIPARKKSEVVKEIFTGKVDHLTVNFLVMVCQKKRSNFLSEIISSFQQKILQLKDILTGQIISPQPLSSEQFNQIHEKITADTGRKVELSQEIDENLIGGFIIKIKDTVIDLSVKNQLEKLRNKLVFG